MSYSGLAEFMDGIAGYAIHNPKNRLVFDFVLNSNDRSIEISQWLAHFAVDIEVVARHGSIRTGRVTFPNRRGALMFKLRFTRP